MYEDFRKIFDDIKNNWSAVSERFQFASSKYFYRESFIGLLLFNRTFSNLPKTGFIDYNLAFQYYDKDRYKITISRDSEEKVLSVPYCEVINFIDNPTTKIVVKKPISDFSLPEAVTNETKDAFNEFLSERPNTTDGPVLRLASIKKVTGSSDYEAKLERASYYDLVRTNLTLDHQLDNDSFASMRINDLTSDNSAPKFEDSQLVNSIGVSSVLAFQSKGIWYYHMQSRQANLGVFTNMLSSVSGSMMPPVEGIDDLVDYATKELKRELIEETGLDVENLEEYSRFDIVPLALTRELTRGGKPQFFFLTVLGELSEKEFGKIFKEASSKNEFKNDRFSNITSFNDLISPEFTTNLLYAMKYMQTRHKIIGDIISLP